MKNIQTTRIDHRFLDAFITLFICSETFIVNKAFLTNILYDAPHLKINNSTLRAIRNYTRPILFWPFLAIAIVHFIHRPAHAMVQRLAGRNVSQDRRPVESAQRDLSSAAQYHPSNSKIGRAHV